MQMFLIKFDIKNYFCAKLDVYNIEEFSELNLIKTLY